MIAFLQYVAALILVETTAPAVQTPRWGAIAALLVGFAVVARVVGLAIAGRADDDERRPLALYLFAQDAGRIGALATFWAIVGPLGGARIPHALGAELPFVGRLLQLAPFLVMVAVLAWGLHPAAAAMRFGARTAAGAIRHEFRDAILPGATVVVCIALEALPTLATPTSAFGRAVDAIVRSPALYAFFSLVVLFALLLVVPFVLRLFVGAKPMPAGPLRERLEAYARRVNLRVRDILVWPTEGDVLNAAVVGALPRFRYVFITDGLLKTLSDDEVEAVFAHEAGHARRGHVLLFLAFTAVFALVGFVPGLGELVGVFGLLPPAIAQLALVGVWLGVAMGWLSRRFEQEADVFGIETLPRPAEGEEHPFAKALARIGENVGEIRELTTWRHFSIDDRLAFVRSYLADAEVRRAYRRSIALLRGTLLLVVGGFALVAAARIPGEISMAQARWKQGTDPEQILLGSLQRALFEPDAEKKAAYLGESGLAAAAAGRDADAARLLRESIAIAPKPDPGVLFVYASLLERTGRPLGARRLWREIAESADVDEKVRELARKKAEGDGAK